MIIKKQICRVCNQIAMTFASFYNSIIASQFYNGGKMIKCKSFAAEKYLISGNHSGGNRSNLCALL